MIALLFSTLGVGPFTVAAGEVIGLTPAQVAARRHAVEVVEDRGDVVVVRTIAPLQFKAGDAIRLARPASFVAKAAEDAASAEAAIRAKARGAPDVRRRGVLDPGLGPKGRR